MASCGGFTRKLFLQAVSSMIGIINPTHAFIYFVEHCTLCNCNFRWFIYCRKNLIESIRAFPFDAPVRAFLDSHATTFVVEQNRDAQLRSLLAIETGKPRDEMISVLDYGGMPLTASVVVSAVLRHSPSLSLTGR